MNPSNADTLGTHSECPGYRCGLVFVRPKTPSYMWMGILRVNYLCLLTSNNWWTCKVQGWFLVMVVRWWCLLLMSVQTIIVFLEEPFHSFTLQVVPSWSWRCLPITERLWLTGQVYRWGQRGCFYFKYWQPWCYSGPTYVNYSTSLI